MSAPGEAERVIIAHGFGNDFALACTGMPGDREALAFMYLSGVAAQSRVMTAQIHEWKAKIQNRPSAMAGLFRGDEP